MPPCGGAKMANDDIARISVPPKADWHACVR
jgi:hypothetical protein